MTTEQGTVFFRTLRGLKHWPYVSDDGYNNTITLLWNALGGEVPRADIEEAYYLVVYPDED